METKFKDDIIAEYATMENLTVVEAKKRVNTILELVAKELAAGNSVKMAGFFNFFVKERAEKQAKHPQTGEDMTIPQVTTVVAKMTKPLKDRVQGKR